MAGKRGFVCPIFHGTGPGDHRPSACFERHAGLEKHLIMLEATDVARLDASDPIWRLSKSYRYVLQLLLAALPSAAIAYFQFFVDPELRFERHIAHAFYVTLAVSLCSFSAYLSWRCYAHTGEPFLRWLTLGLLAGTVVTALYGLATPLSLAYPWLFLFYGRISRLAMVVCLLVALLHAGQPTDTANRRGTPQYWLAWLGAFATLGVLATILPPLSETTQALLDRSVEAAIIASSLVGIGLVYRGTDRSPLMALLALAFAFFGQAAFAFLIAPPWSHPWWLAHLIFAAGFLFLSYGTAQAFLTTRSFINSYSSEGLLEKLIDANKRLESALADAHAANEALGAQVAITDQAKQQFESLFAQAPDATLVIAPDSRILKANERARQLFGYSPEDLQNALIEDLIPGVFHPPATEDIATEPGVSPLVAPNNGRVIAAMRRDGSSFLAEVSLGQILFDRKPCIIAIIRDNTEARCVAKKIQQSEQSLRDIFDHAPIGMALMTLEGRLFEVNESLCHLLGQTRDPLRQMAFEDIAHPEERSGCLAWFEQLIDGTTSALRAEKRLIHRDGGAVWVLLTASLQRDAKGEPLHILSQIVDIGPIKAVRDALSDSERRLQRVLEGSNDGFWDRHIPSGITTFSPRWAGMLGYASDEIAPAMSSWENLVHPDDLPLCRRLLAQHLAGYRDRYEAVYRMRHRGGHWIWILARGKAYEWDAEGRPVRMAGTHTDVTVRQLTMEALRMREQTLKAVLEALPIGIWIANAEGRITSANAAALAMYPGVRYRALVPEGEQDGNWGEAGRTVAPHDWALNRAIKNREKVTEQLVEIEFSDGSKKTVLNSGLPILDEQGNPLGAVAVNQDMTTWLKLEQDLLQRSQQLEESNRELEQFAYVASHDLQEPLRKVSSFAQLFSRKYSDRLDQTGQTYIDFMVDGANRMQTLIDDLLHYSRLTRGGRTRHEVDMNRIMQGVLADLQLAIRDAGADVRAAPLPVILGDAGQLRALMQNLISNAVKYRAKDRCPIVEIGARKEPGIVTFWIRDNGIGIHPRYFERIFVIFQRLHARSEYPGTGIGLAICKKIVDNHGGRIWVESTPEQGATFFFTLQTGAHKT